MSPKLSTQNTKPFDKAQGRPKTQNTTRRVVRLVAAWFFLQVLLNVAAAAYLTLNPPPEPATLFDKIDLTINTGVNLALGVGFLGLKQWAWPTAVILVPIELISYLSRPISLSVRLFANMMAGHILLKVFTGFILLTGVLGVIPLAVLIGITALEFLVAVLQAYIFTILTCVYLHDAIHLH